MQYDVPVADIEIDSWCTPADATIDGVVAGSSSQAAFCTSWDGLYHSTPFTPNTVVSSVACNDPAPTWIYEIEPTPIDTELVKVSIDSTSGLIWLKPLAVGTVD
jgi:hypothetical protein